MDVDLKKHEENAQVIKRNLNELRCSTVQPLCHLGMSFAQELSC